jgi:hypothetical protein
MTGNGCIHSDATEDPARARAADEAGADQEAVGRVTATEMITTKENEPICDKQKR